MKLEWMTKGQNIVNDSFADKPDGLLFTIFVNFTNWMWIYIERQLLRDSQKLGSALYLREIMLWVDSAVIYVESSCPWAACLTVWLSV